LPRALPLIPSGYFRSLPVFVDLPLCTSPRLVWAVVDGEKVSSLEELIKAAAESKTPF
jgi:hypothetical protein